MIVPMETTRGAAKLAIGAAIAFGLLAGQAGAAGGTAVVAAQAGQFVSGIVVIEQGEALRFVQAEPARIHDVTATAKDAQRRPLFASDRVMSVGQTSMVVGVATLDPGHYEFHCSIHPGMKGTLIVASRTSIA